MRAHTYIFIATHLIIYICVDGKTEALNARRNIAGYLLLRFGAL